MLTFISAVAMLLPRLVPIGDDAVIGTYSLHMGAESRAICRLLGSPDLSMRCTLRADHRYVMERMVNGQKTGEVGGFRIEGDHLTFNRDDASDVCMDKPEATISGDHIHIGDLDFSRTVCELNGLWVHISKTGHQDKSLTFRFTEKGHFRFVAAGDPPSTSEGTYELADGVILLHYSKVDGKSVEDQGYGTGKLPLGEDGTYFMGAFGGRFERASDDK